MNSGYHFHVPALPLSEYIDHFWLLHEFPTVAKQMIVPDGGLELILNCGRPQRLHNRLETDRFEIHKDCWISGLRHRPIVIGTPGPMSIIGVRFKLLGGCRFLGVPMHEITDRVIDATLILGNSIVAVRDRIACAMTIADRFGVFEQYLLGCMTEPVRAEPLIARALAEIARAQFRGRVDELAETLSIGSKHLRRLFRDLVGVSPKWVFRIHRFQRLLTHLESAANPEWASLAARFGFFDQAHLIKEFQAFTDSPPSEYMSRRGPYLNYLSVN